MMKIRKDSFLGSVLSDISEEELRRTELRMTIATEIARTLKEKKMSQKEFACLLNKRPSEISKWLSGKHNFTIDTLSDIEHVLNIQLIMKKIKRTPLKSCPFPLTSRDGVMLRVGKERKEEL